MEHIPDYYQLLHVQPDAPAPVIKASYRAMMQKMRHHPDLGGDSGLAQRLNEAVSTLCDPARREEYDSHLAAMRRHAKPENRTGGSAHPGGTPRPDGSDTAHRRYQGHGDTQPPPGAGSWAGAGDSYRHAGSANEPNHATGQSFLPTRAQCPFCHTPYAWARSDNNRYQSQAYSARARCVQCHGATTPISAVPIAATDDLRKMYRYDHDAPVELWTEWPSRQSTKATMVDLSLTGCAIVCNTQLAHGLIIVLDTPILNSVCQIRYCHRREHDNHYAMGLSFMTLDIQAQPGAVFSTTA